MSLVDRGSVDDPTLKDIINLCESGKIIYDIDEPSDYVSLLQKLTHNEGLDWEAAVLPVGNYVVNGIVIERFTPRRLLDMVYPVPKLDDFVFQLSEQSQESIIAIVGDIQSVIFGVNKTKECLVYSALASVWTKRSESGTRGIVTPLQFLPTRNSHGAYEDFSAERQFAVFLKYLSRK